MCLDDFFLGSLVDVHAVDQREELTKNSINCLLLFSRPSPCYPMRLVGRDSLLCAVVTIKQQTVCPVLDHGEVRRVLRVITKVALVVVHQKNPPLLIDRSSTHAWLIQTTSVLNRPPSAT